MGDISGDLTGHGSVLIPCCLNKLTATRALCRCSGEMKQPLDVKFDKSNVGWSSYLARSFWSYVMPAQTIILSGTPIPIVLLGCCSPCCRRPEISLMRRSRKFRQCGAGFLQKDFSHQPGFTEGRTDLPRKALWPEGSNCFSRGSVPIFLRKHIATCAFSFLETPQRFLTACYLFIVEKVLGVHVQRMLVMSRCSNTDRNF